MTKTKRLGLRIVSMVACVVCLLCSVQGVAAAPEQTAQTMTTKIRNGAYYSARVIGQMENGTQVTVLDTYGDFYLVDCYDMTGYIAASQLTLKNEEYYVNCVEGSSETAVMDYTDHADALAMRHSLLALAQELLGVPYVYGGSSPSGFDCSGFTQYLYGSYGERIERTASAQLSCGIAVSREGLQVGDLIFFREPWQPYLATHVGIYAGNNQIIHAGNSGICYADLDEAYFANYYLCARRVIITDSSQLQTAVTAETATTITTGRRGA